jgi:hypothetical protein
MALGGSWLIDLLSLLLYGVVFLAFLLAFLLLFLLD